MNRRLLGLAFTSAIASIVALVATPASAQTPPVSPNVKAPAPVKSWKQGRTPDGQPDLQGIWSNATTTPLERPAAFAGKAVLTDQERAELERQTKDSRDTDRRDGSGTDVDVSRAYNDGWWERGPVLNQTSLIVDPPDGKLPASTDEGKKMVKARMQAKSAHGPADSWEDRSLQERCMVYHGVPPLPTGYNNNYRIAQTPGYVSIVHEMIHETRMIPLDGRPHLPSNVRLWLGDSRGHWDGDTLVVENTNFRDEPNLFRFPANGNSIRVIERFRRIDADHIDYRFTIDDPQTYQRPWTAVLPLNRIPGPIYEYACHEGNYGMVGILRGARVEEERSAQQSANKSK
jgi:hypothetical protein